MIVICHVHQPSVLAVCEVRLMYNVVVLANSSLTKSAKWLNNDYLSQSCWLKSHYAIEDFFSLQESTQLE